MVGGLRCVGRSGQVRGCLEARQLCFWYQRPATTDEKKGTLRQ